MRADADLIRGRWCEHRHDHGLGAGGARLANPPVANLSKLRTENDVEQKLVYPFLVHPSFLDIPAEWVRTKEYMEPTAIDKGAGKRVGYIPDCSVWRSGLPSSIRGRRCEHRDYQTAVNEAEPVALISSAPATTCDPGPRAGSVLVHDLRDMHQNWGLEIIGLSCRRNLVRNRPAFGAGLAPARRFNGQVRR